MKFNDVAENVLGITTKTLYYKISKFKLTEVRREASLRYRNSGKQVEYAI